MDNHKPLIVEEVARAPITKRFVRGIQRSGILVPINQRVPQRSGGWLYRWRTISAFGLRSVTEAKSWT